MLTACPQRSFLSHNIETFGSTRTSGSVLNFGFCVIVGQEYAGMLHRFEKFNRQLNSGLSWKIPFVDEVAYVHDLREQVVEILPQTGVTKDNVQITCDGVIYIQVIDPIKASYNVEDYVAAISNLAQTTMRSEIGKLTLDQTLTSRDELNEAIINAIKPVSDKWGIDMLRYEVKDIEPPTNIQRSMILQAEAERNKRAEILASEGTRTAEINIAEAKKIAQVLQAEGKAQQQILQANAQAKALSLIDNELQTDQGRAAAQFLMGQRYIEALKKQAKKENTYLVKNDINFVPR